MRFALGYGGGAGDHHARPALPPGHDDCGAEGGHQEAGDVLQPAAEGRLPSESDGQGNIDAVSLND